MKLRTEIKLPKHEVQLNHQSALLLCGSCFAENIGRKLQANKFKALSNPFGISYNPLSLFQHLSLTKKQLQLKLNQLQNRQGLYYHFDFHSTLNADSEEEYAKQALKALKIQAEQFAQDPVIIISLGTAWIYRLKSKQLVVNNCHKNPNTLFEKELLDVDTIVAAFQDLKTDLKREYQKNFRFIFTISPVRHLKDGFRENQLSKAVLQLAVAAIEAKYKNVSYFPAYELLQDDLRDYRFYAEDLLHPNEQAISYIWNKFVESHLDANCQTLLRKIEQLNQSLNHQAFNPKSEAHQNFLKRLLQQLQEMQQKHGIDYEAEIQEVQKSLIP